MYFTYIYLLDKNNNIVKFGGDFFYSLGIEYHNLNILFIIYYNNEIINMIFYNNKLCQYGKYNNNNK